MHLTQVPHEKTWTGGSGKTTEGGTVLTKEEEDEGMGYVEDSEEENGPAMEERVWHGGKEKRRVGGCI
jgi:hypothetical protein